MSRFRPFGFALALICGAGPALADLSQAVDTVMLPGFATFAKATTALEEQTESHFAESGGQCDPTTLRPAFNKAFDAWMAVSWLHFGPSEEGGTALAIRFWPDPKGLGAKAQRGLLLGDPASLEPELFAKQSVAARGLTGLERLLYPGEPPAADPCPLLRATVKDLARLASVLDAGWTGDQGFAQLLLRAGSDGNTRFFTRNEALQAVFTQLMGGLEFIADQRLGRPLGEEDKPRPERAEARASGRATRNILLELQAIRRLTAALEPDAAGTIAAMDRAIVAAGKLDEPELAGVSDPERREKILEVQRLVRSARAIALSEMAPALGVGLGFNSQDGD
ncbi:imelysin family protein [Pseudomonas sp. GX19020]|uniref:imelysin family protein n=1 Tax=Pseudomonas sp. GX19020 TaxID=2942277 RepID=UPI002018FE3C|nr:imelysin family protein [Pseudomonas sp. GX19020]MCL4066567.1 imelysin family protein [Pseudomonas sp. GX19020]